VLDLICGFMQRRKMPTLYLIAGPWGAGKTSAALPLAQLLPECVVFDWDALIPGISEAAGKNAHTDPATWEGLRTTWLAVIRAVLAGGRSVVLFGPATPRDFENSLNGVRVECAYLECPPPVLEQRLKERGETAADIADELAYAAELRGSSYIPIPTEARTPLEVAQAITQWVRSDVQ